MGISDRIMDVILALIGFRRSGLAYFPGGTMSSVQIKSKEVFFFFFCFRL